MTKVPQNRITIRKQIQNAGNNFYESLSFCKPLQYLAGELMAQNEEYVPPVPKKTKPHEGMYE